MRNRPRFRFFKESSQPMFRLKLIFPVLFITILVAAQSGVKESAHARPPISFDSIKTGSLCASGERVVWSCKTERERKLASICSSKDLDRSHGYVQYRFGRPGQVELEFPGERAGSQALFKYSRYTRPLVTRLKLEFVHNGFTYTISDDSNDEEKPSRRDTTITVTPSGADARETTLRCRLPVTGSLMKLEDAVQREDYTQ